MNVVYDKRTLWVLAVEDDGHWDVYNDLCLVHFEDGFEPVFTTDVDGNACFVPNASIITCL